MKWHHINTIKYLCTNLNINKIIIDKKTNSSSLSESHFNWLSFFSSTNFSQAVNCFKALRISVRSCSISGQTLLSFFSILLSFQKVGWSVFIHYFIYIVSDVVVKMITIWEWWEWEPICVLYKPFS